MAVHVKLLPAMGEYTSVSVIGNAELIESSHEGEGALMMMVGKSHTSRSNDGTAVDAVASNTEPAKETVDLGASSALVDPASSGFQPALVMKSAQAGSFRKAPHLRRTGTLPAALGVSQLSKADLKARQKERIERKAVPPKKHSLHDRAAYKIDQYISTRKGQTISLACVGLVLMLVGACILKASQPGQQFHEMVWQSWTFLGDAGSHTSLTETGLRIIGVVMTLVGILYFSVIMGFVVDGIREKMDSLKKGKSKVLRTNTQ